ncbi:MAG: DUF4169 family protein [Alphaproteobacteria bacterium]|nr:DUF4169 family protein [Alphaproteobacteria bacterium]
MAEIVNLRLARKRAERGKADAQAAENRAVHGVPKRTRERSEAERASTERKLDQHRIEPGDRE